MTTIAALPFLPDAVIFDMDGLMIDSERVSLACWSEAADEFGLGLDEAVFLRMVGLGDRDTHALLRAQGSGRIVHVGSRSAYTRVPAAGIDFDNLRGEGVFNAMAHR